MRRRIFGKIFLGFVILAVLLSAGVYFFAKPFILSKVQEELRKVFKESSIQGLKITQNFLELQGVEIKEPGSFYFKIKEARAYYNLDSIIKQKRIDKISLNGIYADVNMNKIGIASGPKGKFSIVKIEILDANINLTKDDIKIKANSSLQLDMATKTFDYVKLNVSSCRTNLFEITDLSLDASQGEDTEEFFIRSVNYNKLKLADVMGKSELKEKLLRINPLSVSFLGGNVKGEFSITLDDALDYSLKLDTQGMEIKRFVDDMELNEKFYMTGRLAGAFSLSGKGEDIKDIKGVFSTDTQGGVLVINDKTFLENVAKQSNQSLDIIVESFRNYNYNNGIIKLFMENGNIGLDLKLDGNSGKRSLVIVLHDFKKGKETP